MNELKLNIKTQLFIFTFSARLLGNLFTFLKNKNRHSWLNYILRSDEAVYWDSVGQQYALFTWQY